MTHLVHLDSELGPPLSHSQSEHSVGCHCAQCDPGIGWATGVCLGLWRDHHHEWGLLRGFFTSIPQTSDISRRVGTTLNTRADNTKLIPRDPRSMVLDRAPVCLLRWKAENELSNWGRREAVISCQLLEPTEIQIVKVSENVLSDCSDAVLSHSTKHRIPDKW